MWIIFWHLKNYYGVIRWRCFLLCSGFAMVCRRIKFGKLKKPIQIQDQIVRSKKEVRITFCRRRSLDERMNNHFEWRKQIEFLFKIDVFNWIASFLNSQSIFERFLVTVIHHSNILLNKHTNNKLSTYCSDMTTVVVAFIQFDALGHQIIDDQ